MDEYDDHFLKNLMATFRAEGAEHLQAISTALLDLETALPEETDGLVETAFREVHSMKGAARSVNLPGIERVSQAMENVFAAVKRKESDLGRGLLDLLHRAVNFLYSLISAPGETADRGAVTQMVADLNGALSARATAGGEREIQEAVPAQPGDDVHAMPAAHVVAAETVRVGKDILDSLLLQVEAFLTVKQAITQRASEVSGMAEAMAVLAKESAVLVDDVTGTGRGVQFWQRLGSLSDRLLSLSQELGRLGRTLRQDRRTTGSMVDNLLDSLKAVSLSPFSSLADLMGKMSHDLARAQGKLVSLQVRGGEIEADRRVLDEMREPLIHLIRNCVDHGIELPEERVAAGKGETGQITLSVGYREGQWAMVEVADDGRGIDPGRVKSAAVRLGVVSPDEAASLDPEGAMALLFRSGLSTSSMITDISGRGLGLPIVKERVERMGGSIGCSSDAGKGTTFRILLPLSLATFRGLLVTAGGRPFVIPLTAVKKTVRVATEDISRDTVVLDDRVVPVRSLDALLELQARRQGEKRPPSRLSRLVVAGSGKEEFAFAVDEVLGEQEVLVKHMGPRLPRVRNVLAATVFGSGEIVPILNVSDLVKSAVRHAPAPVLAAEGEEAPRKIRSILVVEDSITSRSLLKNILEAAGYAVRTAVDGVDALAALGSREFDLVVSDVDMPRMNGFELTAKIRSDTRLSPLPVVLVTSLQSREDQERGIEVGANAYIVKGSFDQSNLLETVRRLL